VRSTTETTDVVANLALGVLQIPKARTIHIFGQHADGEEVGIPRLCHATLVL